MASESIGLSCNLRIALRRFVIIDVTSKSFPVAVSIPANILSAGWSGSVGGGGGLGGGTGSGTGTGSTGSAVKLTTGSGSGENTDVW